MDTQLAVAIVFLAALAVFLYLKRKNVVIQKMLFPLLYFVMYRSDAGLKSMDSVAKKFPKFLSAFFAFGVVLCFIGMAVISYQLIYSTINLAISPETAPGIQPVLPFQAKGVFFVPFLYWIISIFVIAAVHEFSHGVASRVHDIKVKSSGFAFLGIIIPIVPAAFVEPDEKKLVKKSAMQQLAVFAAGPFANIATAGIVILLILFVANPLVDAMFIPSGVEIAAVSPESPAALAGIAPGEIITNIDGMQVTSVQNITFLLAQRKPGQYVTVQTNKSKYKTQLTYNPKNETQALLGISSRQFNEQNELFVSKYGIVTLNALSWVFGLLYWIFLLSIGIGLFNLLPIGPIDGGRMLRLVMHKVFDVKRGESYWRFVSMFFLFLVISNIVAGFFV